MKFRVTILRHEIFFVELTWGDPTDALADLITSLSEDPGGSEEEVEISGGTQLHSERDTDPLIPGSEKDYDSWIVRPFGFNQPVTDPSCRKKD